MNPTVRDHLTEAASLGALIGFFIVLALIALAPPSLYEAVGICGLGAVVGIAFEVPWLLRRARRLREAARLRDWGGHVGPVERGRV